MNNFFLYSLEYKKKTKKTEVKVSATVIFLDKFIINETDLQDEIRKFYSKNYQTDEIYIIGPEYQKSLLNEIFIDRQDKTFIGIPKRQDTFLKENLYIITFDKHGKVSCDKHLTEGFSNKFINEGLQNIFIKRGGLITSPGAHHFVFPSGKHCDKFLRTGNILMNSSEINFMAFSLLRFFDEDRHDHIYCDTSSINSVAFALVELKNRFLTEETQKQLSIKSFSSYEGLYKNSAGYSPRALILISASTSANILTYIQANHKMIDKDNIVVLYFLGDESKYLKIREKVACNLTHSKENEKGIISYSTFTEDNCQFCKNGSYPVEITGDVFLLEKPRINRVIFNKWDADKNLSDFVKQFKSVKKKDSILKVNYKENSSNKYEVYINYLAILIGIKKRKFKNYSEKLNDYIDQYVPSNLKYILCLNDNASKELGKYIRDKIKENYQKDKLPVIISQENLAKIDNIPGAIIVASSCISNGKNLLYISRALRKHNNLKIIYFIGISRTRNKEHVNFLKSNLKLGCYGLETNSFIEVDSIFCNNQSVDTSWLKEIEFLKNITNFLRDDYPKFAKAINFFEQRKKLLQFSGGEEIKGLSEELFYPRINKSIIQQLSIRKNFAFFNFDKYDEDVTQSDIYFTISNIFNNLRNSDKQEHCLKQSIFVRNLIDPGNFNRFNDGIIQASILRAACSEELSYEIDSELSQDMFSILETLIKYHEDEQGEALLEFVYAIAQEKLSLKKMHLVNVIELLKSNCKEQVFISFIKYIEKFVLNKSVTAK